MDRFFNFVSLRQPPEGPTPAPSLQTDSDFQRQLAATAEQGVDARDAVGRLATSFLDSEEFLADPAAVPGGERLLQLAALLKDHPDATPDQIAARVREAAQDLSDVELSTARASASDSVLAAYLAPTFGERDMTAAAQIARTIALVDARASGASDDQLATLARAPFLVPSTYFERARTTRSPAEGAEGDTETEARRLLTQFNDLRARHERLSTAVAELQSHSEDELLLAEGETRAPLDSLYTPLPRRREEQPDRGRPVLGMISAVSPLIRAAARTNVFLSEPALSVMSESTRTAFSDLDVDPSRTALADLQQKTTDELLRTNQQIMSLTLKLDDVARGNPQVSLNVADIVDKWRLDPVDEQPPAAEPVATTLPTTHTPIKPLGVADLLLVRTHLTRYERAEVVAVESVAAHEKLTRRVSFVQESESTTSTSSETTASTATALTDTRTVAQATANQLGGNAVSKPGTGSRGPLTGEAPATFAHEVTDHVTSELARTTASATSSRLLLRTEDRVKHVFDNTGQEQPAFVVYQALDAVRQAQVFNYGSRLLYDVVVPEPAALYREAIARSRGGTPLGPRPLLFTTAVDKLSDYNWAYYATGHQATGVEPPPAATVIVTETFGDKATDAFANEMTKNTLQLAQHRTVRIPKGYAATKYRVAIERSGWNNAYMLRVTVGTKHLAFESGLGGATTTGTLMGETETLPVTLMVDGDGQNPGITTLTLGVEIVCEPSDATIAGWQAKAHAAILAGSQRRLADWEERAAARDAAATQHLRSLSPQRKAELIQTELKRTTLSLLTGQSFASFSATSFDSIGLPFPHSAATQLIAAYVRFFEQAIEWEHIESAFYPYFWGSRSSWISKLLAFETDQRFADFLRSGAARVVLPVRPGYEAAVERFLATGTVPDLDELLDAGGPLWVPLVNQLRERQADDDGEQPVGEPWEFRVPSGLVRARRDDLMPKWTAGGAAWTESPDNRF